MAVYTHVLKYLRQNFLAIIRVAYIQDCSE
jgi:hypothetical protein